MKILILYYSKTGFTKRYASWLSEETGGDLIPLKKAGHTCWDKYDIVVLASRFHAGRIQKLSWFKKHVLSVNRRIVMVTGAMPAGEPDIDKAIRQNFPADRDKYAVFYLPSGLCYEKMGAIDRLMMKAFCSMMQKKPDKTPAEQAIAQAITSSFDNSSKEYLKPVVTFLQKNG